MVTIAADLTARVCIITFIYSILSYVIIERYLATPNQLAVDVPLLLVTFGVVVLIGILFDLRRFRVWSAKR